MRFAVAFLLLLGLAAPPAHAEWLQASSAHFTVYADDTDKDIRRFSGQLERYHAAMAAVTGVDLPAPSPSNRVSVYVVKSGRDVRRLYGEGGKNIGGFYIPRAGGSLAIVPQVNSGSGDLSLSMIVLLHEYAHHFTLSSSAFAPPRWFSEGGAEFFASASFPEDGGVILGRPAMHRAGELLYGRDVKAADLLDPEAYEKRHKGSDDAFYGKSWLLYHYLSFEKSRAGQMNSYLRLLIAGKSSREAGLEAFGDFDKLESELDGYLKRGRFIELRYPGSMLHIGPVEVRKLSEGEAAMMPVMIRSRRGVTKETAPAVLAEARAVAARFPADPGVQAALAEAEYDAGNDAEALAAADAALARDPSQVNAYVQKGLALFRMAGKEKDAVAAFAKARAPFVALNRIENDHPMPLVYYYLSFREQGNEPSALAVQGLERAVQLAPFDLGLRMMLAKEQLSGKRQAAARLNLTPIAYNPHGGGLAEAARKMLARLDADPAWDGMGEDAPEDSAAAGEAAK